MLGLADQVGDDPVTSPGAELIRASVRGVRRAATRIRSASRAWHGRVVRVALRRLLQRATSALFRRQPVPEPHADASEPLYAADARSQFRTEETGIGSLVRDPANGREAQIDRGGRGVALLKVNAVAEDHRAVEREAGLRAVPSDELANGVLIGTLPTGRGEAVEDCGLGVFEIPWCCPTCVYTRERPLSVALLHGNAGLYAGCTLRRQPGRDKRH
jgi:hypothetical protein